MPAISDEMVSTTEMGKKMNDGVNAFKSNIPADLDSNRIAADNKLDPLVKKITKDEMNDQTQAAVTSIGINSNSTNNNGPSRPDSASSSNHRPTSSTPGKRSVNDFVFGKQIGEGSFSMVFLAKDTHTQKEFAIKVCEKQQILREKKTEYVKREREAMNIMSGVPGFPKFYCTFQDERSLYFVMSYAKNGDMLPYITKVGSFDIDCTKFYAAELVLAIENMHKRSVIHRDLKPENLLLNDKMHMVIADFGSVKILNEQRLQPTPLIKPNNEQSTDRRRRNSFVGTAQYVSPEVLRGEDVSYPADLWALGCIIYQMVSGLPPFRGHNEYAIFEKILKVDCLFPEGFDKNAESLVSSLLCIDPKERLGSQDKNFFYESIRSHKFFEGINWDRIHCETPPKIGPYLPGVQEDTDFEIPDNMEPGFGDKQLIRLIALQLGTTVKESTEDGPLKNLFINDIEKQRQLEIQRQRNRWHSFAEGELILKEGIVFKRKGLFARKRMLLLTTGPRLIYIDPDKLIKKGEIPFNKEIKLEPKNFKIFFVITPNRVYYLEDPESRSKEWCTIIESVRDCYLKKNVQGNG